MVGRPLMKAKAEWKAKQPTSVQAPSDPKPVQYRLADLAGMDPGLVADLKTRYVAELRKTARPSVSAEAVGVTKYLVDAWLETDKQFLEDVEHARQCRIDEIEADLEGSTNRSGGDVTARIFMLKGLRPEKFHDRVVQDVFSHGVFEPDFSIKVVDTKTQEPKTH